MDIDQIKNSIRNIPDFPQPGIQFKDITTLLMEPEIFSECIEIFYEEFNDSGSEKGGDEETEDQIANGYITNGIYNIPKSIVPLATKGIDVIVLI